MSFKPREIEFMKSADLARLATIQPDGTLQNNPVGFS
jgi:pyridoxamine 5'-phosphate oxidase family protein